MKRRDFLVTSAAGVAGASVPARADNPNGKASVRLRMASAWPTKIPGNPECVDRMAKRVSALTDGAVAIEVLHADKSGVPPLKLLDAVAEGKIDMAHSTAYYWTERSPGFNFFATVPFGMLPAEHYAWLRFGGGVELWDKLARKHGVLALPCGNTGVQMGGWFRNKIVSAESLRGLRIRFPGLGGEIYRKFGATPVLLPAGEIKTALRDGKIDAAEWVTPWNDMSMGLHEHCNYYYYPGIHEPGHTLELLINPQAWSRLAGPHQEAIRTAAWMEFAETVSHYSHENATRQLDELRKLKSVQVLRLPNDVVREFRKHAPAVMSAAAEADPLSREIHKSYSQYLQQLLRWAELSDRAYWQARYT